MLPHIVRYSYSFFSVWQQYDGVALYNPYRFATVIPAVLQDELYRMDKVGPPAMAGFIVAILATIFIVGVVDLVQCL